MLTTNSLSGVKECVRCDRITGYTFVASVGRCEETCGDGLRLGDACDDGNTMNGDGCSSICSIEPYWECTSSSNSSTSSSSNCSLSSAAKPTITAESITKLSK